MNSPGRLGTDHAISTSTLFAAAHVATRWHRFVVRCGEQLSQTIARRTSIGLAFQRCVEAFAGRVVGAGADRAHKGRNACALVLGSRGRSRVAELLLGSVCLEVAARADCPVIVLRGGHDNQAGNGMLRRIALGVGEERQNSEALRFAFQEAQRRGAALDAVRAWRCPVHESVDHLLLAGEPARLHEERAVEILESALNRFAAEYPSVELRRRTAEGPARRVLLDASTQADLLVVGARRRQGHLGLQLGQVAHTALHHSRCPVVVVSQGG
ncbi:universal stress protein [Streptomyces sp. NBC_00117]|nr:MULTISPECIES: universal stress protein [unclassified Streptomyces]